MKHFCRDLKFQGSFIFVYKIIFKHIPKLSKTFESIVVAFFSKFSTHFLTFLFLPRSRSFYSPTQLIDNLTYFSNNVNSQYLADIYSDIFYLTESR